MAGHVDRRAHGFGLPDRGHPFAWISAVERGEEPIEVGLAHEQDVLARQVDREVPTGMRAAEEQNLHLGAAQGQRLAVGHHLGRDWRLHRGRPVALLQHRFRRRMCDERRAGRKRRVAPGVIVVIGAHDHVSDRLRRNLRDGRDELPDVALVDLPVGDEHAVARDDDEVVRRELHLDVRALLQPGVDVHVVRQAMHPREVAPLQAAHVDVSRANHVVVSCLCDGRWSHDGYRHGDRRQTDEGPSRTQWCPHVASRHRIG